MREVRREGRRQETRKRPSESGKQEESERKTARIMRASD